MGEIKTVVFSLNDQLCGIDTSQVSEIIRYQEVSKIPKMPKFIEGIISLRGKVVPVINLNKRFDIGETEITKKTKIIITEVDHSPVGFIVNDVTEIVNFSENDIERAPDVIHNDTNMYLKNIGKRGNMLVSILDFSKILTDKEMKRLEKLD